MEDYETEDIELQIPPAYKVTNGLLHSGCGNAVVKDTVPIFRAKFGNFGKWPRDGHNEVNDIVAYGV